MGNSSSSSTRKASSNKKGPSSTSTAIEKKAKVSLLSIGSRVFRRAFSKTRKSQTTKPDANKRIPPSNTSTTTSPANVSFPANGGVNQQIMQASNAQGPAQEDIDSDNEPELLRETSKRGKSDRNLVIDEQEEQEQPQVIALRTDVTNVGPANSEGPENEVQPDPDLGLDTNTAPNEAPMTQAAAKVKDPPMEEQVRAVVEGIFDSWGKEDLATLKKHVIAVRRLLSKEKDPPIKLVRESEVGPILIEITTKYREIDAEIVFESLWAITNIASGTSDDTNYIVNLGILPILSNLLAHSSNDVVEQAIWCLGNIAGDSPVLRDVVLNLGINDHVARLLGVDGNKISMRRNTAWLLSNMCRGKPEPMLDLVVPLLHIAVPYIHRLTAEDNEVLCDLLWAVSYISQGTNDRIHAVVDTGVTFPICTILLGDSSLSIVTPGIRTLGNVLSGSDTQTQIALDHGTLRVLKKHFTKQAKRGLVKEILWALSNIAAGRPDQLQLILDDEELLIAASEILLPRSLHDQFDIMKEAIYILANLCESGSTDQLKQLAAMPLPTQALFKTSFSRNSTLQSLALGAIERLIDKAGCILCVQSIKKDNDAFIQSLLEDHTLERCLRFSQMRYKVNFATLLAALGCSPLSKIEGTNVTLIRYGLEVTPSTGIRLNHIGVLYLLMGPVYFKRFRPKNGIWLPRELWMLFHKFYFDDDNEEYEFLEEVTTVEDLNHFHEGLDDENRSNESNPEDE